MKTKQVRGIKHNIFRVNPRLFLFAAAALEGNLEGKEMGNYKFCCNTLAELKGINWVTDNFERDRDRLPENRFLAQFFKPEQSDFGSCGGWWHIDDSSSRVIALLLTYHIARESGLR